MFDVIVTRHPALLQYLVNKGYANPDTPVISHATPADVEGKHVLGVLPLSLAAFAASVTEVPLSLTPDMRGRELSLAELEAVAGEPRQYYVRTNARDSVVLAKLCIYDMRDNGGEGYATSVSIEVAYLGKNTYMPVNSGMDLDWYIRYAKHYDFFFCYNDVDDGVQRTPITPDEAVELFKTMRYYGV